MDKKGTFRGRVDKGAPIAARMTSRNYDVEWVTTSLGTIHTRAPGSANRCSIQLICRIT